MFTGKNLRYISGLMILIAIVGLTITFFVDWTNSFVAWIFITIAIIGSHINSHAVLKIRFEEIEKSND